MSYLHPHRPAFLLDSSRSGTPPISHQLPNASVIATAVARHEWVHTSTHFARGTENSGAWVSRRTVEVINGDMASAAGDGTRRRKTACVTGGSGYIASALVKMLLEKGYAVKTTVRNPDDTEKNSHLKDLQALGPLEVFRADLDEEGSFDGAVAGCDYAFLVAAPVNLYAENPEKDVIEPAIHGTLNVMRSCVRAGTVKRVVLTSSAAAVSSRPLQGDGHVLDEESWSDVEFLRSRKTGPWAYPVSKVLLEKAACAFALEHGISLVTVCPVVTVGAAPAAKANTSVPDILSLLSGDDARVRKLEFIERRTGSIPMVHIDDLCRAEVFVAEEEAASGRYNCGSVNTTVVELARFLAAKYPQYNVKTDRFAGLTEKPRVCISSAKLVGEGFEFRYKNLDQIYDDVVEYGRGLGILPY
uniref:NAD-dependent epimerase/dehydratase domain-containing protein n=2 Tax=Hordeum vulgare subsp. vulgare TaxID=112509 RepID=A0A8I6XH88_HORVV